MQGLQTVILLKLHLQKQNIRKEIKMELGISKYRTKLKIENKKLAGNF